MANRARLGGSPLGLIGLKSSPDVNGNSTFNGGNSRNVNVANYNKSRAGTLFTGKRTLRAWPDIQKRPGKQWDADGKEVESEPTWDTQGLGDVTYPVLNDPKATDKEGKVVGQAAQAGEDKYKPKPTLHNNTVYDTSILNIIEQLAPTKASLKPADFAYLKNVGVYPNNRLMIARRFASPSGDNIMMPKGTNEISSIATLISWSPEGQDFLDFTFGEEWENSEADFKGILNSLGDDIGLGNLGGIGGAMGNALPLPGFSEIFQRAFLAKLGLLEESSASTIPAGNPNLIKQAKQRKTIGYSQAGSGLKTTINIKMTCEYELKYISGIDPSIVWMDLLGMILRFGTSSSETYGLKPSVAAKLIGWANNPDTLIRDVVKSIADALNGVIEKVKAKIKEIYDAAVKAVEKMKEEEKKADELPKEGEPGYVTPSSPKESELAQKAADAARKLSLGAVNALTSIAGKITSGLVQKYRVKIIGIVNALSGLPSTPWHITIGNPMRPMFCSGDMLVENVQLKLGPQLSFNDLPSTITVEFTLTNARPLGLQEIMAKFNSGYLRTVDIQKSFYETKTLPGTKVENSQTEPLGLLPLEITQERVFSFVTPSNTAGTPSNTGGVTPPAGTGTTNTNPPGASPSVPAGASPSQTRQEGSN
jgi:hypothetical protein